MKCDGAVVLGPYEALLFDMDGTILMSLAAAERAWSDWAHRIRVSAGDVLGYMHGRRAMDTISHFLPTTTDIDAEVRWLDERELEDLDGVAEVPGAGAFLRALPSRRWAVVTSANRALALKRIEAAGLPAPPVLVSSDDVFNRKAGSRRIHSRHADLAGQGNKLCSLRRYSCRLDGGFRCRRRGGPNCGNAGRGRTTGEDDSRRLQGHVGEPRRQLCQARNLPPTTTGMALSSPRMRER